MVCTNALCFEAQRVRDAMSRGERLWQILVAKNLAMAVLITVAALPVIAFLTVTNEGNPIAMVDQLVTMVFIWLGVGNVLSVLYPLRHEPVSARLRDGTWKPYLFSFALSYGVGLTVNLMIFWRLWSRQTASAELAGGEWAAFLLVLPVRWPAGCCSPCSRSPAVGNRGSAACCPGRWSSTATAAQNGVLTRAPFGQSTGRRPRLLIPPGTDRRVAFR